MFMIQILKAIEANPNYEPRSVEERRIVQELIYKGYVNVVKFETGGQAFFTTHKGDAYIRLHQ